MRDDAYLQISHELIAQVRLSTGGQAHHCDYDLGLRIVWFGDLTVGSGLIYGGEAMSVTHLCHQSLQRTWG